MQKRKKKMQVNYLNYSQSEDLLTVNTWVEWLNRETKKVEQHNGKGVISLPPEMQRKCSDVG